VSNAYHNKADKQLITRKELADLIQTFIDDLLKNEKSIREITSDIISKGGMRYFYNDKPVSKEEFNRLSLLEKK
tara:strand:+ start:277 stop:498 length:222 start_codon:yes stop_codon:yes gene_type:complete